jgi:hypothetical protein
MAVGAVNFAWATDWLHLSHVMSLCDHLPSGGELEVSITEERAAAVCTSGIVKLIVHTACVFRAFNIEFLISVCRFYDAGSVPAKL